MSALTIRIKKNRDGTGSLSCTRADGTATWTRQREGPAQFFALHDLTHYAVETVLGHRLGFFGLAAQGWDLDDFGSPWPRGPIPADADPSELIVGFLDAERASGGEWELSRLGETAAQFGLGLPVTAEELARIRIRRAELFDQWEAVSPGNTLELSFDPRGVG